jgi:hypothetical protein
MEKATTKSKDKGNLDEDDVYTQENYSSPYSEDEKNPMHADNCEQEHQRKEACPANLQCSYRLNGLTNINTDSSQFDINMKIKFTWERSNVDSETAKGSLAINKNAAPRLKLKNGSAGEVIYDDEASGIKVKSEGAECSVNLRITETVLIPDLKLSNFPFDTQNLQVQLQSKNHGEKCVWETPKKSSKEMIAMIDANKTFVEKINLHEFVLVGQNAELGESDEADSLTGKVFSTYTINIAVKRRAKYYLLNVYSICFVVTTMSFMAERLQPDELADRLDISQTAFLTLVAFKFSLGQSVPKISYLTLLDWYFLICFFFICAQSTLMWYIGGLEQTQEVLDNDKFFLLLLFGGWMLANILYGMRVMLV